MGGLEGMRFVIMFYLLSVQTNWDVERLADHVKNTRPQSENGSFIEAYRLAKYFENPQFGEFNEPATVLDRHGRIILWYLPLVFSRYRVVMLFTVLFCFLTCLTEQQNDLNAATLTVRRPLDSFMKSPRQTKSASWRHSLFNPPLGGGIFGAGVLNMSPGWFQQSQDVSFGFYFVILF
jgi:hypothetical protein